MNCTHKYSIKGFSLQKQNIINGFGHVSQIIVIIVLICHNHARITILKTRGKSAKTVREYLGNIELEGEKFQAMLNK